MVKKKRKGIRHVPQRTCVGCREVSPKNDLLRLVRTPQGVLADPSGKMDGRGAYIHGNQDCLSKALKGKLENALRVKMSLLDQENLVQYGKTLPLLRKSANEVVEA